jgi:hypothetical protein
MHKSNIDMPYYEHLRSLDEERLDGWNRYLAEVQSMSFAKKVRLAKRMLKEVPGDPDFNGSYVTTGTSKLNLHLKFRTGHLTFKLPRKLKKRIVKALRLNGMSYADLCFMERHSRHVIVRRELDRRIAEAYNNAQAAMLVEMDREVLATCKKASMLDMSASGGFVCACRDASEDVDFHSDNDSVDILLEQEDEASDV